MAEGRFVAYYRVSTARQGVSGLGLEAQQAAVASYLNGGSWKLVAEFTEVESGKKADRPQLTLALAAAKKQKATLVIAKLDRLARNVAFVANLMDAGVDFIACDFPTANRLTIHILAAVAEHEAKMISARTKAALAAAKARGKVLGWAMPERLEEQAAACVKGASVGKAKADEHAATVMPVVESIRRAGANTLVEIATALNNLGVATARGGKWYPTTVKNLLDRTPNQAAAPRHDRG
jgi:DNA invertase Pin-like site-specific DNA recombinase